MKMHEFIREVQGAPELKRQVLITVNLVNGQTVIGELTRDGEDFLLINVQESAIKTAKPFLVPYSRIDTIEF